MSARTTHLVAAWCLDFPTEALLSRLPELQAGTATVSRRQREAMAPLLEHLATTPLEALQLTYVDVFDMSKKFALYLSYWTDGDTRRRGEILAGFKARYRASGWLVDTHGELPDYLPMVLEYAAVADPVDGPALLQEYRPSLELLKFALQAAGTPYAGLIEAVCDTLPGASPADAAAVHRMAANGPPREQVGLDAYDPRLLPLSGGAQ
ncbi:MAG: nitrate reductase molybdenum cofactor assembly chaperone [Candidatus Nanopelagicales bacterium]